MINVVLCVDCDGGLECLGELLRCEGCGREYSNERDIMCFLDNERIGFEDQKVSSFYNTYPYDINFGLNIDKDNLPIHSAFSKEMFSDVSEGDLVLDVGCGVGKNTLAYHALGCKVIGLDQSMSSLEKIRSVNSSVCLVNASVFHLPLRSESFDVICSIGVLHHTHDTQEGFFRLLRLLKPGGKFYVSVYRKYGRYYFVYFSFGYVFRKLYSFGKLGKRMLEKVMAIFHIFDRYLFGKRRSAQQSRAFFADYFLVPIANFHTEREVSDWVRDGFTCQIFREHHPDMVSVIVTKNQ